MIDGLMAAAVHQENEPVSENSFQIFRINSPSGSTESLLSPQPDNKNSAETLENRTRSRHACLRPEIYLLAIITLLTVATLLSITRLPHRHPHLQPFSVVCNPSSLKESTCIFDPMTFAFLPRECHDEVLTSDFLLSIPDDVGQYFVNASVESRSLSTSEMEEGVENGTMKDIWVQQSWWRWHCVYMWRKMHRGLMKGVLDDYVASVGHTNHCSGVLLNQDIAGLNGDEDASLVRVQVKFSGCLYV